MMTARVSMLLKSRATLTCFRVCFLPGRAKDLSAPRQKCGRQGFTSSLVKYDNRPAVRTSRLVTNAVGSLIRKLHAK